MRWFLIIAGVVWLGGCGGKTTHAWKGQTQSYFERYQKMMLKGESLQAEYYLKDSLKEAKNSPDITTLAKIYLGACAMEKAMMRQSGCASFLSVEALIADPKLSAYKKMLLGETVGQSTLLGKYEALYEVRSDKEAALGELKSLDTIYAKAVGAAVIKDAGAVSEALCRYMVDEASSQSMKGLMLLWKKEGVAFMVDPQERSKEIERIKLLSE